MVDESAGDDRPIDDERFRALVDGAHDGLFVLDPETGEIEAANRTVCDWLGYDRESLLTMTIFDCQTTFSEPGEWQAFVQRVRDENGVQIENEIRTRSDGSLPVEGSVSVVSIDGDEHVVAIPRQTTAQRE